MTWWTDLQAGWMPGDPAQPTDSRRKRYEAMREVVRSRVGHMLVDDTDYIPEVRRAVDDWLAEHPDAQSVEIHDGHHGMVLIGWGV